MPEMKSKTTENMKQEFIITKSPSLSRLFVSFAVILENFREYIRLVEFDWSVNLKKLMYRDQERNQGLW